MSTRIIEGKILEVEESFFDMDREPSLPRDGHSPPEVFLVDHNDNNRIITKAYANAAEETKVGYWTASVAVPHMELTDEKQVTLLWLFETEIGTQKAKSEVIIEPAYDSRIQDVLTVYEDDTTPMEASVVLKSTFPNGFIMTVSKNNETIARYDSRLRDNLEEGEELDFEFETTATKTKIDFKLIDRVYDIAPYMITVRELGSNAMHTRLLYTVTNQCFVAMTLIRNHIDKARLANVIPELETTEADLMTYLYRGLNLFNQFPPMLTDFTGTNMQGLILDAWVTCSSYYALAAQLQAEGALAFDFGGQAVSFNVDRSPSIENALGKIEQQIESQVRALKKSLGKKGVYGGDGSVGGDYINGSRQFGRIKLSNNPVANKRVARSNGIGIYRRY